MRKNVGGYDRIARIVLGAALTYLSLSRWQGTARGKLTMMTGTSLLSTGLGRKCPGNSMLGRNTHETGESAGEGATGDLPA
jgi:hypothetical protein